jgi:hypothetical protein
VSSHGAYSGFDGERLRWVEQALEVTRAWIEKARADSGVERFFSTPGEWDYDYATDLELEAKQAEQTLQALEAEHTHILACQEHLKRDTASGKYPDAS